VVTSFFPFDVAGVTSVTATLETDVGILVTDGTIWPGGDLNAPPNPCTLTVTLG
jgi:hypothetical protein